MSSKSRTSHPVCHLWFGNTITKRSCLYRFLWFENVSFPLLAIVWICVLIWCNVRPCCSLCTSPFTTVCSTFHLRTWTSRATFFTQTAHVGFVWIRVLCLVAVTILSNFVTSGTPRLLHSVWDTPCVAVLTLLLVILKVHAEINDR